MNVSKNNIFTTSIDTRDYAIKILMENFKNTISSVDIPTNLIAIRHPNHNNNIWIVFNKTKRIMFNVNTSTKTVTKMDFNTEANNLKLI